jgi:hypothetical protein
VLRPSTAAVIGEQVKSGKRASQGVNGRNSNKRLGSSILLPQSQSSGGVNTLTSSSMTLTTAYASTASSVNDSYMSASLDPLTLQQQMSGSQSHMEMIQNQKFNHNAVSTNENSSYSSLMPNNGRAKIG